MSEQPVTTESPGQTIDQNAGRIFPCEQCGADLEFHIGQQRLKCPFCSFEKDLTIDDETAIVEQDFRATLTRIAELREQGEATGQPGDQEIRCESCGANVMFRGVLTSSECPFCGSPIQREKIHTASKRISVDGVLPFKIEQPKAKQNLAAWVRSRWFAPNEFKRRGAEGKFTGVYLPFWTYDSFTHNRYRGERGEHYYVTVGSGKNRRRERRTRWYPASGQFERFFDDVLVVAATGVHRELIHKLEPWPFQFLLPFNQEVMAGFIAQTYDLELDKGFTEAKQRIDAAIYSDVCSRIGGDEQRVHEIHSTYDPITYKHLLLPVWLLAYKFRSKTYQVVINAVTGEVQGERPWSWIKITLLVLAILAVVGVIALIATR